MRLLKLIFQNTSLIIAFTVGGAVFGGSILTLTEQMSKHNYYLTKANLALAETNKKYQKLMAIQDSIIRLDSKIFNEASPQLPKTYTIQERLNLMQYYIQTNTQLDFMLVHYRQGMDQRLRNHYYSKYKSFFDGMAWDKGGYDMGFDNDEIPIHPDLPE